MALSATLTLAVRAPVAVGVNVTVIAQFAPVARLLPQVFVWLKSPLLVPVTVMPVMLNAAVPAFDSVTDWVVLLVPTN